jgi:AraC family transcriptional regulator, positive regulator of tynA and feaB
MPTVSNGPIGMFASMGWIITAPINDVQNDRVAELAVGDMALVDASRCDLLFGTGQARWIGLHLPRQSLISHLGIESEGGCAGIVEALASRLCFRLVQDAVNECDSSPLGQALLQLAIYYLLVACFLPLAFRRKSCPIISSDTDKLFKRVCAAPSRTAELRCTVRNPLQIACERG